MRFTAFNCDDIWSRRRDRDADPDLESRALSCVDAPDTSGQNRAAEANAAIAGRQQDLAERSYADAQARQARFDPRFEQLIDSALASQQTQDARSAEQWDLYRELGLPAERRLADAAANFDTPERRAQEAEAAVAGVDRQFEAQRDAQRRQLARTGSSVSGNRALTLDAASRFANAKTSAAADRNARRQVEATGLSLTDAVAARGRGMTSTGLQAAGLALNAGNTAGGNLGQQQSTYNASLAPTMGFYQGAVGANNSAGSIYGDIARTQQQSNQGTLAGLAGLGGLAGTLLTAPMGGTLLGTMIGSDPKTKDVHGEVSGKKALRTLASAKVYDWTYKKGEGDGRRHLGRMAGEGDVDTSRGKAIDVISEIGTHHAAIAELARDVKSLKRRLSLGDVEDAKMVRRAA